MNEERNEQHIEENPNPSEAGSVERIESALPEATTENSNESAENSALPDGATGKEVEKTETEDPEVAREKTRKKKRNTILTNIAFIVINAIIILVLLLVEDKSGDKVAGAEAMRLFGQNVYFILAAFAMFFVIAFADSVVFAVLIRKTEKKTSFSLPLKVSFMGRYYDRITPWAIGGEPFQIATLMQGGLSAGDSCAVTMSRHIVRFFTNAIAVVTILIASRIITNVSVMVVAILSVAAGLVIPSFMLLCAFKPKIGLKIGQGAIGLLYKLKLIKNYDKQMEKMQTNVNKFLSGIKYLSTNKIVIVMIALAALIELFANNSVPFLVIRGLGHSEVTFWRTMVLCIYVNYASSFAPTPGGAGIAELSFYAIFAAFVEEGYLFWAVLFWRIAIFFVPVFIGFVMQIIESVTQILKANKVNIR